MRTFRLVVAYEGTEFHGWQLQSELRTVQGELESALEQLPLSARTRVAGAGRTDAGVHARGQVASFSAETDLPVRALAPQLNRRLPRDVRVMAADEVESSFHARHSAIGRRYAYRLLSEDDVLWRRMAWNPWRRPELEGLERAVKTLEGSHDFSAFQAQSNTPVRPECVMHRAGWTLWEGGWRLDVIANRFLYHMVRNIVGTALMVCDRRDPGGAMREVLESRERRRAGETVPAHGLTLEQVYYAEGRP